MSSSATSSSTSARTLFAMLGRPTSACNDVDLEAQLEQPSPARTHTPRQVNVTVHTPSNAFADFFGAPRSQSAIPTGTRDSRHDDSRPSVSMVEETEDVPPPYEYSLEPPTYSVVSDQPTLAMYLFKFGFLFPLFWVAGALILLSPLSAPPDWELTKSQLEREELIASMRRVEVKWGRRCLVALSLLTLVVFAIVLTVMLSMRS